MTSRRRRGSASQPRRGAATNRSAREPVRFAVVGAGHIAQNAVLPSFRHARKDCALTALISGDARKRRMLASHYGIERAFDYDDYDEACRSGLFDAVYI